MTEHRNVTPKTEVSTNFYGSVTGIVDNAYIQAHGGGGVDTNAVRDIVSEEITPATNRLNQTISDALDDKRDKDDLAVYKLVKSAFIPVDDQRLAAVATGDAQTPANGDLVKYDAANGRFVKATAGEDYIKEHQDISGKLDAVNPSPGQDFHTVLWGDDGRLNVIGGLFATSIETYALLVFDGFMINAASLPQEQKNWNLIKIQIGQGNFIQLQDALDSKADRATTLAGYGITNAAPLSMISASDQTFSNAVMEVGLNIDTNSVAVLNDIAATFGGFPIEGTATTVGGLIAALAAAIAWLKKNKVQTLKLEDGSVETSADGGVAKLDDFFTESNSLLNARITYKRNATGLKDRAFNSLSFDGTEYNLSTALADVTPTASGQPRDLLIVATATAATTISFTAGTIKGDKPTIDGSGTWLITLTEYASGVWYCRQIKMEDAA